MASKTYQFLAFPVTFIFPDGHGVTLMDGSYTTEDVAEQEYLDATAAVGTCVDVTPPPP